MSGVEIGQVVDGKYRLLRFVGHGAMASVYEAEHVELQQRFALKTTRSNDGDGAGRERFLREARSAARVDHPNVVRIVDCGRLADGRPYLIMDYVDGNSLGRLIEREGTPAPARVTHLLRQLAAAIDAIHACGLLHRDLKPDNVVLSEADGRETLRVVDFGLVLSAGAHRLTERGLTVGTVAYMSPEACTASDLDGGTDVYALGAIAFELFTGRPPFDDEPDLCSMVDAKVHEDPPRMSDYSREHADLTPIFDRVLARDAYRRHRTATVFVDELERTIGRRRDRLQWARG